MGSSRVVMRRLEGDGEYEFIWSGLMGQLVSRGMVGNALGRRLKLRRNALPEVRERLESTLNSDLDNADLVVLKDDHD